MLLTITQAEHNAAIAAVVASAVGTNTPAGDRACASASAASASTINPMRGGRPAAVVPPTDTAAGAADNAGTADTKLAANAKKEKSPADPLSILVVNPDHNKARWGTHKAHCVHMSKAVEDCRGKNTLHPRLYGP